MKTAKTVVVLLLLVLITAGCSVKEEDFNALQSRVAAQERKLEELRPHLANQAAEIEDLRNRIAKLEGKVDSVDARISAPDPESVIDWGMDDEPPLTDSNSTGLTPDEAAELGADAPPTGDPALTLYNQAMTQFKAGNYKAALKMWDEFGTLYPQHKLMANTLYWQGECYFGLADYPNAILSYQKVIESHKQSPKYPAALLKQGVSFIKIGKQQAGEIVLNDVIAKFPNTPEARKATEFLRGAQ